MTDKLTLFKRLDEEILRTIQQLAYTTDPNLIHGLNDKLDGLIRRQCEIA